MEITPIRTKKDYRAALRIVSKLVDQDPSPDTPAGEHLDVLSTLIEAYERKHYPIDLPDPVEAIKFRMEQAGLREIPRTESSISIRMEHQHSARDHRTQSNRVTHQLARCSHPFRDC